MNLYRTQNSFILRKPPKKIQNAVWQWVSTRACRAWREEWNTVIFLVITAAENLYTNSYIHEKMNKQNPSEWMEIFKFLHNVRKHEVHRLWKCFVDIKTWGILSRKVRSSSFLLQLLLNYFKPSSFLSFVQCWLWGALSDLGHSLDVLKMLLHFLKEMCFSRLFTAYFLCQLLALFQSTLSLSFSLVLLVCPDLKKKKKITDHWEIPWGRSCFQ